MSSVVEIRAFAGCLERKTEMFKCPDCREAALEIEAALELPPDSQFDEIALQICGCRRCGFRCAAVYEESRRGAVGSESWTHVGYRIAQPELGALASAVAGCGDKRNWRCQCAGHLDLGRRDQNGRWERPPGLDLRSSFAMER